MDISKKKPTNTDTSANSNLNSTTNNVERNKRGPRKQCSHCNKFGHDEDKCWVKHPELKKPRENNNTETPETDKTKEREKIVGMVTVETEMFELLQATHPTPIQYALPMNTYISSYHVNLDDRLNSLKIYP